MKRSDFFIMKTKDSLDKTQYKAGINIQMKYTQEKLLSPCKLEIKIYHLKQILNAKLPISDRSKTKKHQP